MPRADPADGGGGATPRTGDDRIRGRTRVPAGVVALAEGTPGHRPTLPPSRPPRQEAALLAAPAGPSRPRNGAGGAQRSSRAAHRRRMGAGTATPAAAEAARRTAEARPAGRGGRHPVGLGHGVLLARRAPGKVRALGDDLRALQRVAQGRSLAAGVESVTIRRRFDVRSRSVAVGLGP